MQEMQKGKMIVWGGLKESWGKKKKEAKGKRGKERYTHLNAEFQRIERIDTAFLSEWCKEIEEQLNGKD